MQKLFNGIIFLSEAAICYRPVTKKIFTNLKGNVTMFKDGINFYLCTVLLQ